MLPAKRRTCGLAGPEGISGLVRSARPGTPQTGPAAPHCQHKVTPAAAVHAHFAGRVAPSLTVGSGR